MAERVGFEPTLEFPLNTLSKRAPSATRPSLRVCNSLAFLSAAEITRARFDEKMGFNAFLREREFLQDVAAHTLRPSGVSARFEMAAL